MSSATGSNCYAAKRTGDLVEIFKAPEFGQPVETMSTETYAARLALALDTKEEWPGGEVTPDARQMAFPPESYDNVFTGGERYAHAKTIGEGLMSLDSLVEGQPVRARENMSHLPEYMENPYAGPVVPAPQAT